MNKCFTSLDDESARVMFVASWIQRSVPYPCGSQSFGYLYIYRYLPRGTRIIHNYSDFKFLDTDPLLF